MNRHIARSALVIGALFVAGCGDNGTSPLPIPHLELSVGSISQPFMWTTPEGDPVVKCEITFHVVSNGTDTARWSRGVMRWYVGKDRSTPVDSSAISGSDLQAFFNAGELPSGSSADAPMEITAGIPFGGAFDVAYVGSRDSKERHTVAPFTCGPESTAGATPPTVAVSVLTPETEILEPGDTILVRLSSASNVGLWRTLVGISGPCDVHQIFNEQLAPSVVHDVTLVLPASCSFNTPITVTGAALDALGVETDVSVPTARFIVDRTPPTIRAWQDRPGNFGGAGTTELPEGGGEYFVGESVNLYATLRDNHAMRALIWEIEPFGARDSLNLAGDSVRAFRFAIPIKPDWGSFQLRLFVRDESGNTSPVLQSAPGAFIVRPSTELPTTTIALPAGSRVGPMIHDARSDRLFVLHASAWRVLVYSATTLALQQTIPIDFEPSDMDVSEGGDTVFVSLAGNSARMALIDLTGSAPVTGNVAFSLTNPGPAAGVRVLAGGRVLLQGLDFAASPTWRVLELDRATQAVRDRTSEGSSVLAARTPDRAFAFLQGNDASGAPCTRRFDALADSFSGCEAWAPAGTMSTSTHGDVILVDDRLYDASYNPLRALSFPNSGWSWPGKPLISPDGATVYRGYEHGVVRARASDGAVVDLIPLPYPPEKLAITADGSALFALEWPRNNLSPALKLSRIALR